MLPVFPCRRPQKILPIINIQHKLKLPRTPILTLQIPLTPKYSPHHRATRSTPQFGFFLNFSFINLFHRDKLLKPYHVSFQPFFEGFFRFEYLHCCVEKIDSEKLFMPSLRMVYFNILYPLIQIPLHSLIRKVHVITSILSIFHTTLTFLKNSLFLILY